MRKQFGQEYANPKDFKKEFRDVLRQVSVVYPDAQFEEIDGGLLLHESRTQVSLALPANGSPVNK